MKILIVEDEIPAADKLRKIIQSILPHAEIMAMADTIETTVEMLSGESTLPDLIFMDIELADGKAFEIFNLTVVNCPVIFTTAYDAYAIEAFHLNSIDYLLKPIDEEKVKNALKKYEGLRAMFNAEKLSETIKKMIAVESNSRDRFLVKQGEKLIPIRASDIAYFHVESRWTCLTTRDKKQHIINYNITELESLVDKAKFFRVNRKYLVALDAITALEPYTKGQVVVEFVPSPGETVVVSRQTTPLLKEWMGV